jgi:hypothetical protein
MGVCGIWHDLDALVFAEAEQISQTCALRPAVSQKPFVVEDALHPRQSLRMIIRRLLGASRLTTSECSSQSRRQASLPPVLLLIRSVNRKIDKRKKEV